jgi:ParB family chromosome partitioning protein
MSSMVGLSKIQVPENIRSIPGVEDLVGTPLSEFPLDERASILALAESIQEDGLINPLTVKDLGKDKGYRLIAGFRRFKALQHLGARRVDVKSVKGKTKDEAVLQLIENIHREDLNPMDVARGLDKIRQLEGIKKQSDLAKRVKKSTAWVSQHLSLLKADEKVQEAVATGEMGINAARSLTSLPKGEQAGALDSAKKEAASAGKAKVSSKGARRQAKKAKDKKKKQQTQLRPIAEREAEQKEAACKGFIDVHFGDKKIPDGSKELVESFWDYLMEKEHLFIFQK